MPGIYDSFGFLFSKASQKIQEQLHPVLESKGLIPKQMGLMFAIGDRPGITQKEAGLVQQIDRTTMTQQIDHLEGLGMVRRVQNPSDRRAYGLFLTDRGSEMVSELWEHVEKAHKAVFSKLDAEQVEALRQYLLIIVGDSGND